MSKIKYLLTALFFSGLLSITPAIAMQEKNLNNYESILQDNKQLKRRFLENKVVKQKYEKYIENIKNKTKTKFLEIFECNLPKDESNEELNDTTKNNKILLTSGLSMDENELNEKLNYMAENSKTLLLDCYDKIVPEEISKNENYKKDLEYLKVRLKFIKAYGQYFYLLNNFDLFNNYES